MLVASLVLVSCASDEGDLYNDDVNNFSLEGNSVVSIGSSYVYSVDTLVDTDLEIGVLFGETWDLTNHYEDYTDSLNVLEPSETPGYSSFTDAHYALQTGEAEYSFYSSNESGFYEIGSYSESNLLLPAALRYNNPIKLLEYPMTEESHVYTEFSSTVQTAFNMLLDEDLDIMADSIRIEKSGSHDIYSSGWGTCQTPKGNYSVLRMENIYTLEETVSVRTNYPEEGTWSVLNTESLIEKKVLFQSNEFHFPIAEFKLDSLDNIIEARLLK